MIAEESSFSEECTQALRKISRFHANLGRRDLTTEERIMLERQLQDAKNHFQSLFQASVSRKSMRLFRLF